MIFEYDEPIDPSRDVVAFGFMTWSPNGTLLRIDSESSTDYIDIRIVSEGLVDVSSDKRLFIRYQMKKIIY